MAKTMDSKRVPVYLSQRICCSRCGEPITDESKGYTERDENGNLVAVYDEACGEEVMKELER